MLWAMGVITANYLGIFKGSIDVTFSASLLASTAASYGLAVGQGTKKKKEDSGVIVNGKDNKSGIQ